MIKFGEIKSGKGYRLIITPNCSISWRHLVIFYIATCCVAMIIALFFALQGKWLIVPFSGLEMLALGGALYISSRNSHYREVITSSDKRVKIEKGIRRIRHQWVFERCWLRLQDESDDGEKGRRKIALGSHGTYVEVGGFLSDIEKDELAFRLKDCIISR